MDTSRAVGSPPMTDQDAAKRSVGERIAALYLPAEPGAARRTALAEEIVAALAQARREERVRHAIPEPGHVYCLKCNTAALRTPDDAAGDRMR